MTSLCSWRMSVTCGQRSADVELADGFGSVFLEQLADIGAERAAIEIARRAADARYRVDQAVGIAVGGGHQNVFNLLSEFIVDPPDHPRIQQADPAAGQNDNVSGMGIGVIKAVAEDHLDEDVGPAPGQLLAIHIELIQMFRVGDRPAFEVLHRQHAAAGELLERARKDDRFVLGEVLAEDAQSGSFRGGNRVP